MSDQCLLFKQRERGIFIFKEYLRLEQGISLGNFMMSQVHTLLSILVFFVMEAVKVKILRSEESFNYSEQEASRVISLLFIEETIIKFVSFPILGNLIDNTGRKKIAIFGYIFLSISLFLLTLKCNIVVFCVFWGLYTFGVVALNSLPLTGDYVDDEYKGKGTGVQYVVTTLAGVVAGSYQLLLTNYSLSYAIYGLIVFSIITCVLGVVYLKGGLYHIDQTLFQQQEEDEETQSSIEVKQDNKSVIRIIMSDRWLIIVLIMSIVGGCQGNLVSTFVVMWAKSFYPQNLQTEADAFANKLLTITYAAVFLFALVIGNALDKFKTIKIFNFVHVMMVAGAVSIILVNNIFKVYIYVCFLVLGIGIAGQMITTNFLQFKYTSGNIRGIVFGITLMIQAIGGFVIDFLGSYLFPISHTMPFAIYGTLTIVSYFVCILVYYKSKRNSQ